MQEYFDIVMQMVLLYGVKIITAAAIFVVGKWIAGRVEALVGKLLNRKQVDEAIRHFVGNLLYWAILVFVGIAALGQLGIQTASFVAVIGAAGLAVGLALQGSLSNFAAGVLILAFRPFRSGDFVELAGVAGVVQKIQIFTTELHTGDNRKIIIPNSSVIGGSIVNYSANDTRRVDLVFGIGYADDIDHAKQVLQRLIDADERILAEPQPLIAVSELGDSSVNFVVRPWVASQDYWAVYFGLTEAVKKAFDAEGISIPFPQRDVHVYQAVANAG